MSSNQTKVALPLRVPPEYIQRLDELAEKMGLDRSEVARRSLRNGMEGLEKATSFAGNPVVDSFIRLVSVLDTDKEERQEVLRVLRSIGEHKKSSRGQSGKGATS